MASGGIHEIEFQLHARRSQEFDRAFGGANSVLATMQQRLQSLNRAQQDISSYQRQQQAADRTRQRLSNLERQHDLLQREIAETSGSTAGLERESLRLQNRINNANEALQRQENTLRQTSQALQQAGVNTENLTGESVRLAEEMRDVQRAQEQAAQGAANFGSRTASAFDAAGQAIAAAGVYTALKEIYSGYQDCVNLASEFEAGMSNIEALSGTQSEAMELLSAKAKELGATTKFTASESAAAMGYMAMAGWDEQDMLAGMDGVLQLAAASGEDLALVSDIVTDSMSAFHMQADETGRFADVLAAAATNANTNVAIMGETFKNSASIAGALGYNIEDVALAVGLMANNGVKGSTAGTALKNTFNGLLDGVTLTGAAFGEYEYSAIKADGTMKSFGSTIKELRGYFEQMTEAERVANAKDIAGAYGYNGLLGILLSAEADYNKLADSIKNCSGAAEHMAQIKLDNLQGDITLAQSAADALKITVGEQFLPIMRRLYQMGTELLSQFDNWVQANPGLVKAGAVFVGIMGTAATAVTGVSAAVRIFQALNVAALFSGPAGAILALAAAAASAVAGFVALRDSSNDVTPSMRELTEAAHAANEAMATADKIYSDTVNSTQAAADVADRYIDKLEAMGDYERLEGAQREEYHNTLSLLCRAVPELSGYIDLQNNKIEGGTKALRANTEAWRENAIEQAKQKRLAEYYDAMAEAELAAAENSIQLTEAKDKQQAALAEAEAIRRQMTELRIEAEQKAAAAQPYSRFDPDAGRWETYLGDDYYNLQKQLTDTEGEAARQERAAQRFAAAMAENRTAASLAEEKVNQLKAAYDQMGAATEETAEALAESADKMNLSVEAAANAEATMQAYIAGIKGNLPEVARLFGRISDMLPTPGPSGILQLAANTIAAKTLPGYASGTANAAPGWALVGEQGPELLFMQGGETVLTNRETERIFNAQPEVYAAQPLPYAAASGSESVNITLSPVYNISTPAGTDREEMQEMLQQQNYNLLELIKEAMAEHQADRRRRGFVQ